MEPDLFDPQDTAALLAIRSAHAHRALTPADWLAAFAAQGLLDESAATEPGELPLAA